MKYKILFIASVLILLASVGAVFAQGSGFWFPSGGRLRPVTNSFGLLVPGITTAGGTECLQISSTGVFSASGSACAGAPAATALDSIGDPTTSSTIEVGSTTLVIDSGFASSTFAIDGDTGRVTINSMIYSPIELQIRAGNGLRIVDDGSGFGALFDVGGLTTDKSFTFPNVAGTFLINVSNLSDLSATSTAIGNLGLTIGTDVQAYDDELRDVASSTPTKGDLIASDGTDWLDFPVGSAGFLLTASSTASNGFSWTSWTAGDYLTYTDYDLDVDAEVVERTIGATFAGSGFQASSTRGYYMHNAITLQEVVCTATSNASSTLQFEERIARHTAGTSLLSAELNSADTTTASTTAFADSAIAADTWLVAVMVDASSTAAYPDGAECWINFKLTD